MLIESAQKQTADLNGDLHFLRFLDSNEKNKYFALNENVQAKIISKAKKHTYTSSADVKAIMESVIIPVNSTPLFIQNMPDEYRSSWENSSQAKKSQIVAEACGYSLKSEYQINNFWSTRDFRESNVSVQRIDESANASSVKPEEVNGYGIKSDYMDWFGAELAKKFRK
jgi:hypothetical protein